jgi:hypothetical protein
MWESIGCSFGGQVLIAIVIVLNGRAGAKYHMSVVRISPLEGKPTNVETVAIQFSTGLHLVSLVLGGRLSTER